MKQIITQHGWCLNANMWLNLKNKFKSENFSWQDNERGYFFDAHKDSEWIKNDAIDNPKMVICHSLGTKLMNRDILRKASHAVLINSFFNFIPKNDRRNLIIRTLKRMEQKMKRRELNQLIEEFITRSFLPNKLEDHMKYLLNMTNKDINSNILLSDFKKLYIDETDYNFFSKDCKILIIKSNNDLILEENSITDLISVLNKIQNKNPKIMEIEGQGHIIRDLNIFKYIKKWLNEEYE